MLLGKTTGLSYISYMKQILLTATLFLFALLNSTAQNDTAMTDCYETFFKSSTPVKNKSSVKLVLENGKETTLSAFIKSNSVEGPLEGVGMHVGLKDLDGDKKKELVTWNFTGGAHCCDEFYFFKNTGPNKYSYTAKLFAGNTCVDGQNNFAFDLLETFGYFFTCFACGLEKEDKNGKPTGLEYIANVNLRYANGKMVVVPGDEVVKQKITKNLQYIKKLGWDGGVKEDDFDDGRRKELAINLAVYYFSFGQNLTNTRQLFSAYYPFKDATKVWKAFAESLANVKTNMSL